jgi:hypothetical protein
MFRAIFWVLDRLVYLIACFDGSNRLFCCTWILNGSKLFRGYLIFDGTLIFYSGWFFNSGLVLDGSRFLNTSGFFGFWSFGELIGIGLVFVTIDQRLLNFLKLFLILLIDL